MLPQMARLSKSESKARKYLLKAEEFAKTAMAKKWPDRFNYTVGTGVFLAAWATVNKFVLNRLSAARENLRNNENVRANDYTTLLASVLEQMDFPDFRPHSYLSSIKEFYNEVIKPKYSQVMDIKSSHGTTLSTFRSQADQSRFRDRFRNFKREKPVQARLVTFLAKATIISAILGIAAYRQKRKKRHAKTGQAMANYVKHQHQNMVENDDFEPVTEQAFTEWVEVTDEPAKTKAKPTSRWAGENQMLETAIAQEIYKTALPAQSTRTRPSKTREEQTPRLWTSDTKPKALGEGKSDDVKLLGMGS